MALPLDTTKNLHQQTNFRIVFLYIVGLFLSFTFWLLVKVTFDIVFLTSEGARSLILTVLSLLFFCLFFSFFANCVYLFKHFYLTLGLILLINIPYFVIFGLTLFALEGFLLLMLSFYLWAKRINRYDKRHAPLDPLISGRIGLRMAITIFILVVSFSFYIKIAYEGQISYFVPRLEKYTVSLSHQGLKIFVPGYNKDMNVDEALRLVLENKFWQRFVNAENGGDLSGPQAVLLMRNNIEEKFNVSLQGKSADYLISYFIGDYVANTLMKYQSIFSGAAALAFFLFLKLFSWLYYLLIRGFAWVWLKAFLATKVVDRSIETIEIEKIVI